MTQFSFYFSSFLQTARPLVNAEASTVAFMAGYLILVLKEQEACTTCLERFQGPKTTDPLMGLTRLLGIKQVSI